MGRCVLINAYKTSLGHIKQHNRPYCQHREKLGSPKDRTAFWECWLPLSSECFIFQCPISKCKNILFSVVTFLKITINILSYIALFLSVRIFFSQLSTFTFKYVLASSAPALNTSIMQIVCFLLPHI